MEKNSEQRTSLEAAVVERTLRVRRLPTRSPTSGVRGRRSCGRSARARGVARRPRVGLQRFEKLCAGAARTQLVHKTIATWIQAAAAQAVTTEPKVRGHSSAEPARSARACEGARTPRTAQREALRRRLRTRAAECAASPTLVLGRTTPEPLRDEHGPSRVAARCTEPRKEPSARGDDCVRSVGSAQAVLRSRRRRRGTQIRGRSASSTRSSSSC